MQSSSVPCYLIALIPLNKAQIRERNLGILLENERLHNHEMEDSKDNFLIGCKELGRGDVKAGGSGSDTCQGRDWAIRVILPSPGRTQTVTVRCTRLAECCCIGGLRKPRFVVLCLAAA
jgi:hypothetical protein